MFFFCLFVCLSLKLFPFSIGIILRVLWYQMYFAHFQMEQKYFLRKQFLIPVLQNTEELFYMVLLLNSCFYISLLFPSPFIDPCLVMAKRLA